ncbi:MAG: hypothetical protein ACI8PZ_002740 [Myxococcota bacterium]|jgi:hypothetical protein
MRVWVLPLLLAACSEVGFSTKPDADPVDTADPGAPDLEVAPRSVELGPTCTGGEQAITLSNVGTATLTLADVAATGAWSVDAAPPTLAPGESTVVTVRTEAGGSGSLRVNSDDPTEPEVLVPLETLPDQPPTITLLRPVPGEVLGQAAPVALYARVSDEETPVETLLVQWFSDVDGYVADTPPDPDGEAVGEWYNPRTAGDHSLRVQVTDTCGNTDESSVPLCQQAGYDLENLDLESWIFSGSARWDAIAELVELTTATTNQVGSAFTTDLAVSGDNVEIEFQFYIGDGTGADGISLTALDTTRAESYLGGTGCGIGYGGDAPCTAGPALPGWSIEVDTYFNDGQDPTPLDHVMFTFDGDVDAPAAWADLPEMEDTGWHTMRVVVSAPRVVVEIDGITYIDQDLAGHFAFPAVVGFTAGTGGATNTHLIDALVVTEFICPE